MMEPYSHTGPDHVELLKWNIRLFKEMIQSLENGDWTVEEGYRGKDPLHYKLLLEGVINKMEEFNQQLEQRTNQLTAQVQQLSEHVHLLIDDVEGIKEKLDRLQLNDLIQKMNVIIEQQDDKEQEQVQQSENDRLKREIDQLKSEMMAQKTQEYAEPHPRSRNRQGLRFQNTGDLKRCCIPPPCIRHSDRTITLRSSLIPTPTLPPTIHLSRASINRTIQSPTNRHEGAKSDHPDIRLLNLSKIPS